MSAEVESLSSILTNSEAPKVEAKVEPEVKPEVKAEPVKAEPEPKEGQPRDESGKFAKAEEKPRVSREIAGVIDERRKRQEVERELQKLQQQKPKTDIFSDPDKAIDERVSEAIAPLKQRYFNLSVKAAQRAHEDFEEVATAFAEASQNDPRLVQAMQDSDDPGEYIYSLGVQLRELGAEDVSGDFVKYRAKITGTLKKELDDVKKLLAAKEAELEQFKAQKAELDAVPRSLNSVSSGPAPKSGEGEDDDLKSIARFNNRKR